MQSQVEVVLQQLLGVPVRHPGFEGLGQAPPEEDQEAGLLCRRSPSDFPEAPGVLLDAPISLTDVGELSCWTHVVLARFCHSAAWKPVEKWRSGSLLQGTELVVQSTTEASLERLVPLVHFLAAWKLMPNVS